MSFFSWVTSGGIGNHRTSGTIGAGLDLCHEEKVLFHGLRATRPGGGMTTAPVIPATAGNQVQWAVRQFCFKDFKVRNTTLV